MPRRSIPLGLALLALALGLAQRPGAVVADTKVDLYVDPVRFLGHVLSVWSPTSDLGHVFGAQYSGYAFPMAPWFALGDLAGLPVWLGHRLWLAAVLAVAAWGVVRLLDALHGPERGVLHAAAGALFIVNPYVVVDANRTSIALLSYAALPWLLLAVHRGLRTPRGWWWPAAFALVLTSTGGGVNAGTTGWLLLGPALLLVYERLWGGVGAGALRPYLVRMVAVNAVAQLWWVIPVLVQARGAPSFLPFSEQPGTIWSTTSLSESLRLMGFWTSYVGVGYGGGLRPFSTQGDALLFLAPVVLAGLVVPALALAGFGWTRRWRYGPFFLLLTLVGLLVMTVGFPDGTPLRRGVTFAYYRVESIQFLRTTYKAGALPALGLAVLGGAAFAALWDRLGAAAGRPWARPAAAVGAAGLAALAAWPLVSGRAPERQLAFSVRSYWRDLARDLDARPDGTRALVEPGQRFAYYRWGGTIDAILPALTRHPVATRWIVPFADRRSTELQWAVDDLIGLERLRPGQLAPLLDLMGVGDLVVAADGDRSRSGEAPAGDVARLLAGLGRATAYGPPLRAAPDPATTTPASRVPALRRYPVRTGGIVRVLPRGPLTVADGGGGALTGLAAYGALDPGRPIAYAPDLAAGGGLRAAARAGASFVIADTDRRRAFASSHPRGGRGAVLVAGRGPGLDGAMLDPFGGTDPRAQTVAVLRGVRALSADVSPQTTQFPERRPFAALDGDPATAWMADRALATSRHVLTVTFTAPRDVPAVTLLPYSDSRGVVREVEIGGRRFAVRRGTNRLPVRLRHVGSLTVRLTKVTGARHASDGAGGIRELGIPGVRVTEALRPPTTIESALRGTDLRADALTYLLERDVADVARTQGRYAGERGAGELRDAQDPEPRLRRVFAPPAARRWVLDGWGRVDPRAPDPALDRLAGARGAGDVTSSSRYENLPRNRGSGAFDGTRGRAWIGQSIAGRPAWLGWDTGPTATVSRFVIVPPAVRVRRPTRVRLTVDGRPGPALAVGPDGAVRLPRPVRGARFRLDLLAARFAPGTPARARQRRAVGIGEIRGAGMPRVRLARGGEVRLACGAAQVEVDGRAHPFAAVVGRGAFEAGRPLRLHPCGTARSFALPAGPATLTDAAGPVVRVDGVRMNSPAPAPVAAPAWSGRVVDAGRGGDADRDGVRIQASGPSWLVLGQSYDEGWRARCDGRDLGAPRPMQGYANAWPIPASCRAVRFAYGPQRAATIGYVVSALGCLALLALLVLGRRRLPAPAPPPAPLPAAPDPPRPLAPRRAAVVAVVAAAVLGFCFGLRAGIVLGPLLGLALWRGVADRVLVISAGALLALAVPLSYVLVALLSSRGNPGGYDSGYANDRIAGHWLALAALTALGLVLWRTLASARAAPPPGDIGAGPAAEPRPLGSALVTTGPSAPTGDRRGGRPSPRARARPHAVAAVPRRAGGPGPVLPPARGEAVADLDRRHGPLARPDDRRPRLRPRPLHARVPRARGRRDPGRQLARRARARGRARPRTPCSADAGALPLEASASTACSARTCSSTRPTRRRSSPRSSGC